MRISRARRLARHGSIALLTAVAAAVATPARAEPPSPTTVVPQLDNPHYFGRPSPSGLFAVEQTAGGLRVRDLHRGLLGRSVSVPVDAGTPLAIADDGNTVFLTSMALFDRTTSQLRRLPGTRAPRQASFSADGRRLVVATEDPAGKGQVEVWSVATGHLERVVKVAVQTFGHNPLALDRAASRGVFVVSTARGGSRAELWDLETGKQLKILEEAPSLGNVSGVAMAQGGSRALVAHGERLAYWDLASARVIAHPEPFPTLHRIYATQALAVSADGERFAAAGPGTRSVGLWTARGERTALLELDVATLAFDGLDRERVIVDGKRAWGMDGRARGRVPPVADDIVSVAAARASATVFTFTRAGDVTAWSLDALRPLWTSRIAISKVTEPWSVVLTPDESALVVSTDREAPPGLVALNDSARLDARTGRVLSELAKSPTAPPKPAGAPALSVVPSRDKKGSLEGNVVVVDEASKRTIATLACSECLVLGRATVVGRFVLATKRRHRWDDPVALLRWDLDALSAAPREVKLATDEHVVTDLSASTDGTVYVTFGSGEIVAFDPKAMTTLRTLPSHPSSPRHTLVRGDLVIVADDDGTFRASRAGGGWITAARSGTEWAIAADDGTFDGSRGAGALLAAAGPQGTAFVDQVAIGANRPDRLLELLKLGSPDLVSHYRARHLQRLRKLGLTEAEVALTARDAPEARLDDVVLEGHTAKLALTLASPRGLARVNVFVDDVPVLGPSGKALVGSSTKEVVAVALPSGPHKIEVSAVDRAGVESLRTFREIDVPGTAEKGDLYYLGLGVSRYRRREYDLAYPAKDAVDLGDVLKAGTGKYKAVHARTLVDEEVSKDAIFAAKALFLQAKPEDTVVLFVAGHGVHGRDAASTYYFVAHDTDARTLGSSGVPFEMLEDLLQGIKPLKKLFLLDTCESGESDIEDVGRGSAPHGKRAAAARQLVLDGAPTEAGAAGATAAPLPLAKLREERFIYNDLARRSGAVVFSSSRGSEVSLEDESIRNGYFTEATIEALVTDRADADHDGDVSTDELRRFVAARVASMTGGKQNPIVDRDNLSIRFGLPLVPNALPILTRTDLPARATPAAAAATAPRVAPPAALPSVPPRGACGCETVGGAPAGGAAAALFALLGLAVARRRSGRARPE